MERRDVEPGKEKACKDDRAKMDLKCTEGQARRAAIALGE